MIPADFPLLRGLPTDDEQTSPGGQWGRHGPTREWDADRFPLDLVTCDNAGLPDGLPDVADTLYAAWYDVASAHDRQLMVFASADEARTWAESVSSAFSCERETEGDVTVFYEPYSERSKSADLVQAWVTRHELQGRPGPAGVVHVVVKERAVLLSKFYAGEGSQVDREESARMQDRQFNRIAAVVNAM
ncbi:hypothetical protein G7072_07845 [Nocardioides sp. HDW12B]|uniref:hypothetical protein n=1 Tax=Nocardioides sp. HDW12B TaxID=2714939 RepID=UPI00140AD446|nr:hypothetical protein [Nocardioides sp. HDW12B]QIK66271.1 hypothetical protein G7072_07845 [Nocardioides sp. HDW12B]